MTYTYHRLQISMMPANCILKKKKTFYHSVSVITVVFLASSLQLPAQTVVIV
jgi:hypothetical protein